MSAKEKAPYRGGKLLIYKFLILGVPATYRILLRSKVHQVILENVLTGLPTSTPARVRSFLSKRKAGLLYIIPRLLRDLGVMAEAAIDMVIISGEELRKHRTPGDCWIAVHSKVYDVTEFLEEHPGGPASKFLLSL